MRRPLAERAAEAREQMDDPQADPAALARTYRRFTLVNALVSGRRAIYRRWVRPRLRSGTTLHLLDIGAGGADIPRMMLQRAGRTRSSGNIRSSRTARSSRSSAPPLHVLAIDPDPRAIATARSVPLPPGLDLRQTTSGALAQTDERFGVILSNHVLHHLSDADILELLADCETLAAPGGVVVHSDIVRSAFAYALFATLTWPFANTVLRGTFIRDDGLVSIRRSRTVGELRALVPTGWRIRRRGFRVEVIREQA